MDIKEKVLEELPVKELYSDLYVASTSLEKNPNDGFARQP